ncbi:MAG: S8 family serine peptidase [Alphaproteobacteria bacterium]
MKKLFIGSLCAITTLTPAFADTDKCTDRDYRLLNPEKCPTQSFMTTGTILGISGGIAAVGGIAALIGMAGGGSSSDAGIAPSGPTTISFRSPALTNQSYLYDSTDKPTNIDFSNVINSPYYIKNAEQYNAIGLNYAHAREKYGKGSEIKIMDNFYYSDDITHGKKVSYFAETIAPSAQIQNINVANSNGTLNFNEFADNISNTKSIYNASWETQTIFATQATTRQSISAITGNHFINEMARAAKDNDSIFVFAAGNSGMTESSALSALPIAVEELQGHFINVVAFDTDTNALANYSNQCGITQDYCIAAPGSNLHTDYYENLTSYGTSFAAPIVTGAIAILQETFENLTSNQIVEILLRTATDLGEDGVDNVYGWGLLNLERATRPIGEMKVAISGEITQRLSSANVTPAIAASIAKSGVTMAAFDEYGRAYTQNLSDNVKIVNRGRAFDRLRKNETANAKFGILEFGSSNVNLLEGSGFLQTDTSQNGYIATNYTFNLSDNAKLFTRGQLGIISARPAPESLIKHFSNVFTASATIGMEYQDWKFEFTIPETIISGNMSMSLASTRLRNGDIVFNNYDFDLATDPAFEYAISYKNITAGFVDNPIGTDEFYVLAKTKIAF